MNWKALNYHVLAANSAALKKSGKTISAFSELRANSQGVYTSIRLNKVPNQTK